MDTHDTRELLNTLDELAKSTTTLAEQAQLNTLDFEERVLLAVLPAMASRGYSEEEVKEAGDWEMAVARRAIRLAKAVRKSLADD